MNESTKIKPGCAVVLNSNGPHMTVDIVNDDIAHCVWFDRQSDKTYGQLQKASFRLTSLTLVE